MYTTFINFLKDRIKHPDRPLKSLPLPMSKYAYQVYYCANKKKSPFHVALPKKLVQTYRLKTDAELVSEHQSPEDGPLPMHQQYSLAMHELLSTVAEDKDYVTRLTGALFPFVKHVSPPSYAPQITAMLTALPIRDIQMYMQDWNLMKKRADHALSVLNQQPEEPKITGNTEELSFLTKFERIYNAITDRNPHYRQHVAELIRPYVFKIAGSRTESAVEMVTSLPIPEIKQLSTNWDQFRRLVTDFTSSAQIPQLYCGIAPSASF